MSAHNELDDYPAHPPLPDDDPLNPPETPSETVEEHADHQAIKQHELQACIDGVLADRAGRTVTQLRSELADAILAAGHPRPPKQWLEAVSEEIADGHRYITGTHADGTMPSTHTN